ncbi:MAG: hypothetical protein ABSC23_18870 [Bryobacteraceae bacterium]|jgi:hypothetical protein
MTATGPLVSWGGLDACPSIHRDLVFAQIAYNAVMAGSYGVVALELARDVDARDLATKADNLWPTMGVALARGASIGQKDFEADETRREVHPAEYAIPLSPGDSMIAALRAIGRLRDCGGRVPELEFIDLPARSEFGWGRVASKLPDSYRVLEQGMAAYLEDNRAAIEETRLAGIDDEREEAMAAALRRHLDRGRRILCILGMAHWRHIVENLECRGPLSESRAVPASLRKLEVHAMRGAEAWCLRWSDMPGLVEWWVERGCGGFDIREAMSAMREKWLAQAQDVEEQEVSARQVLSMEQYLGARLMLARRFVPQLDGDLVDSAEVTVSQQFGDTVKRTALRYRYDRDTEEPQARLTVAEGQVYLLAGNRAIALGKAGENGAGESRSLAGYDSPIPLREEEKRRIRRNGATFRYPSAEDRLQRAMVMRTWRLRDRLRTAERRSAEFRVCRFEGDLGRGVQWRRTESAWARGEPDDSFFVKIPVHRRRLQLLAQASDGDASQCPVVWLFRPHCKIAHQAAGTFESGVYSSFYWIAESGTLAGAGGLVNRETVAYATNCLRGRIVWEERELRKLMAELPDRFKPSVVPWRSELRDRFFGPDLAVAAGIRWADRRVIVVAGGGYVMPEAVWNYARDRGVEIVRLPLDAFDWRAIRRLPVQHTMLSPLFGDPERRLVEQCEPVPEELLEAMESDRGEEK